MHDESNTHSALTEDGVFHFIFVPRTEFAFDFMVKVFRFPRFRYRLSGDLKVLLIRSGYPIY